MATGFGPTGLGPTGVPKQGDGVSVPIAGIEFPVGGTVGNNNFCGPFKATTGNFYGFFRSSSTSSDILPIKATTPTIGWATQTAWGRGDATGAIAVAQEGNTFHVVSLGNTATSDVKYRPYDASTDTWGTEQVISANQGTKFLQAWVGVRSDGDVIVLYPGAAEDVAATLYARVVYARREGGSWTSDIAVGGTGVAVDYYVGTGAMDDADRAYFFYGDKNDDHVYKKDLSSANSLGSAVQVSDTATSAIGLTFMPAMGAAFYLDGTVKRITAAWIKDTTGHLFNTSEIDDNGTPSAEETATDNAVVVNFDARMAASVVVDGKKVYIVYADASTQDIFSSVNNDSAGWETDIEEKDAITVDLLNANVYDNSGTKIGLFYKSGASVLYDEITPAAGGPTVFLVDTLRSGGVIPFAR